MTHDRYRPLDGQRSPRFSGIRTFMRLPHVGELDGVDAAVLGVPFDTATSFRAGTRFGPEAIRAVSGLLRPYNPLQDVEIFERLSCVDRGDLPVVPGNIDQTYELVTAGLAPLADRDIFPLVLGGDHSITLAELRALSARHGPLSLIHLDSHADTWDEYFGERYTHGTTFRRAAEENVIAPERSVQAGMRGSLYSRRDREIAADLGFRVVDFEELCAIGPQGLARLVRERVGEAPAFLSFDVDFVDPAFAPGTGTPEAGGPTSAEALRYVRALRGIRLVGADCVEVSPPYDSPGQPTALLAATVAWEMLALRALAPDPASAPRTPTEVG
ncbi:MAG TPA: agmatinase [Solirubrobacteraceae bacterium]|nr:agmatinase [Solirubrobacteraceae bacterium]